MRVGGLLAAVNGRIMEWIIRLNMFRMVFSWLSIIGAGKGKFSFEIWKCNENEIAYLLYLIFLRFARGYGMIFLIL